jgi:hypothetical protein
MPAVAEFGNVSANKAGVTKETFVPATWYEMRAVAAAGSLSVPQAVNQNPVNCHYCVAPSMFSALARLSEAPICR